MPQTALVRLAGGSTALHLCNPTSHSKQDSLDRKDMYYNWPKHKVQLILTKNQIY